jgi:hypothetical protein
MVISPLKKSKMKNYSPLKGKSMFIRSNNNSIEYNENYNNSTGIKFCYFKKTLKYS